MILALLFEEPMHAYRMQKLMKSRGKDAVVNVRQRTSVHQTLDRLLRLGLIRKGKTERSESHPDRTVYAITSRGRETAEKWLKRMLSAAGDEFPDFPAALSVVTMLPPAEVKSELRARARALREELKRLRAARRSAGKLPRVFLLDENYRIAIVRTEISFLEKLVADMEDGSLRWDQEWIRSIASEFEPNARGERE
ncbi:MAG TPA: helix-turn-helix transcriptional regulator [Verrucomicrobiae bacterium]|nr:helix-turn-helix transcriptional regulator [Verrucomicrobiae bacterium]